MRGVLPPEVIALTTSPSTAPFWHAAAEHRLVVPRCTTCGTFRLPPSPFCQHCRAQDVEWVEHDGDGRALLVHGDPPRGDPARRRGAPGDRGGRRAAGTGGCRLVGNLVDCDVSEVRIGLPVTLDWYDVRPGESVPVFRRA